MQGLCVSIKENEVHLQLKEYKEFSSQIAFYSLESLILPRIYVLMYNQSF